MMHQVKGARNILFNIIYIIFENKNTQIVTKTTMHALQNASMMNNAGFEQSKQTIAYICNQ